MVENNIVNKERLASEVVDSWDMDTLIEYAKRGLILHYTENDGEFQRDWNSTIED